MAHAAILGSDDSLGYRMGPIGAEPVVLEGNATKGSTNGGRIGDTRGSLGSDSVPGKEQRVKSNKYMVYDILIITVS